MKAITFEVTMTPDDLTNTAHVLLALSEALGAEIKHVPAVTIFDTKDEAEQFTNANLAPAPVVTVDPPPTDTLVPTLEAAGVEVDSAGLPWDARIHGEKKSKTVKDNVWKKKRNLDAALVATVEAELRATMLAPAPATDGTPPPPADVTAAPPPPADVVYVTADGNKHSAETLLANGWLQGQIDALPTETISASPVKTDIVTFPVLAGKITAGIAAQTLTDGQVKAALERVGIASLPLLAARPDLMPSVQFELFNV